jgi:hypothetical protein
MIDANHKTKIRVCYFIIVIIVCLLVAVGNVVKSEFNWKEIRFDAKNKVAADSILSDSRRDRTTLSLNWSNLPVISPLAKLIETSQSGRCDKPAQNIPRFGAYGMVLSGLGSSLHVWSHGLCHCIQNDMVMVTRGEWNWMSEEQCGNMTGTSPLQCYFGPHESPSLSCLSGAKNTTSDFFTEVPDYLVAPHCEVSTLFPGATGSSGLPYDVSDFRAASIEWLFQSVNPIVIQEAERQIQQAFGPEGLPDRRNMITVNVRWGDKAREMELQPISRYIDAVDELLRERNRTDARDDDPIHIYLASEDPRAIDEFKAHAQPSWIVHSSGPTNPLDNTNMMAQANGKNGLESLGALLVAMESYGYVLTTGSNWSRLINELRKNVVNPRCRQCTKMIDLLEDEWR